MNITQKINNKNYKKGLKPILIVIHHTASTAPDLNEVSYANSSDKIGYHYLIGKENVYQLADLDRITWHAGVSSWGDIPTQGNSINYCSIGIEVHSDGYIFSDKQVQDAVALCAMLIRQFNIDRRNIVRHADVAPTRKWDVGENFYKKIGTWADVQDAIYNLAYPKQISQWAQSAAQKAKDQGIVADWSDPQQIVGTNKLAWILHNMNLIETVYDNGVSLEQFVVALDRHNLLKKYETKS